MTDRTGAERFAAAGVAWRERNQACTSLMGYRSNAAPFEEREDLPAEVGTVHREGSRFPTAAVADEDFLGDSLEQGFARRLRVGVSAVAKGREHRPGPGARLSLRHVRRVADDLPDPSALMLAMDEVALGAGRHHPDAVSPQFGVPDVADRGAAPEGIHTALGKANSWHEFATPNCCIGVRNRLGFRVQLHKKRGNIIITSVS